jgi:hypothetical protein
MLLIATLGNDIRFVFTMKQVISDNKMQQLSSLLFYKKEICSLIRNCKALGQNKETNSSQVTTNSQSCWLKERIASHINHQYTYLESCQLDKENISQESGQTRLIFKEGILKLKSKMQERLSSSETFSQFIAMGKVNSTQLTFTFTFNQPTQ